MNEDSGHLYDDDYQFKYFLQVLKAYAGIYKHVGTWIGTLCISIPFITWFVTFMREYEFYLNDQSWLALIGQGIHAFIIAFVIIMSGMIGYSIEARIRGIK